MTPKVETPVQATPAQSTPAQAQGLVPRDALEEGAYYEGECRNARIARWCAARGVFVHWRTKFGHRFLEEIRHPEDEPKFDVLIATRRLEPDEVQDPITHPAYWPAE